jgi:hypothetical protein
VLERYGLNAADLGRVQFFTSETIVLERELTRQTRVQDGAELRFRDEMQTDVVEVSERTPCVVLRVDGDYLLLGFSPKDMRAALWFAAQADGDGDSHSADRRYSLVALENAFDETGEFTPRFSKGFLIRWSGEKYHVVSGRGAYLLYQMNDNERHKVEHTPPGWRVSERGPRPALKPPPTAAGAEPQSELEVEP